MKNILMVLCICAFSALKPAECYLEFDGWVNIELHHALDANNPEAYQFRGNITVPSLSTGLSTEVQEALTEEQKEYLKTLAEQGDYYKLKSIITYSDGKKQLHWSATKACMLLQSQLNDVLFVTTDTSGYILSLTETVTHGSIEDCSGQHSYSTDALDEFNTEVLIRHMEQAPVPDTVSFIQKVEREREDRERGEGRDNRSFLSKYWMYLVPVVLLVFITGTASPDGK